ncbi:hypothetical protein F0L74_29860 [Chitinophaga agrisoli]|uniref:Alginate export domain-containing protein n=1 Tax=Chitinophaga agrisoli TaxID=2607653 RepID=A0A5B2VNK6_9BACT|nr:alginate export family protein [Chitinophaga agrisoli]KAA2240364.1 hypothetical protein F0L74_29860 [Chitinophaga agrisoli]
MKKMFLGGTPVLLFCAWLQPAYGQLSIGAQLRTRTELRDGQGAPLPKGADPAIFTSQRTRLSAGFSAYRIQLGITLQDVRVWGQDASTINRTTTANNNGLLLHEAWADILLTDTSSHRQRLSVKIGRQELMYDDSRLLGNLDWLQQGRRHDAVVLKYEQDSWMLHVAGAFNQNKENAAGTIYDPTAPGNYTGNTNGGNSYKSMQYLYAGKKLAQGNVSFLFMADQFSRYHTDSINNLPVKTWEGPTYNRMTTGLYFNNTFQRITLTGAAYYQFGKNGDGQSLSAGLLSAAFQYALTRSFSAGAGVDYTSGGSSGNKSHAFDPLYGTPHKFWGNMDYFYVASGFGNRGLQDYYIKTKLKAGNKWVLQADAHEFFSASTLPVADGKTAPTRRFGTEADLTATFTLTSIISFEGGYSHFWNTNSLAAAGVKNIPDAKSNSNWAYLMISIRPSFLFHP